jgi:4-hydroxy-3-methylbut-2-enyl diphosphate reductase
MATVRIAAPLLVERLAVRSARTPVIQTGMGPDRSRRSRAVLAGAAVLVAGVGGGLVPRARVGDIVVASEVRGPDGARSCDFTELLMDELGRAGLPVHCGPIVSRPKLARRAELARLAAAGALAVDMESWWLAPDAGTPFAVVRAISDGVDAPLFSPTVVRGGMMALRALRRAVPALDAWAAQLG